MITVSKNVLHSHRTTTCIHLTYIEFVFFQVISIHYEIWFGGVKFKTFTSGRTSWAVLFVPESCLTDILNSSRPRNRQWYVPNFSSIKEQSICLTGVDFYSRAVNEVIVPRPLHTATINII